MQSKNLNLQPLVVEFTMASVVGFQVSPFSALNSANELCYQVQAQNLDGGSSTVLSSDFVTVNVASPAGEREREREQNEALIEDGNGRLRSKAEEQISNIILEDLAPLWGDGYGTQTFEDFFVAARQMNKFDPLNVDIL